MLCVLVSAGTQIFSPNSKNFLVRLYFFRNIEANVADFWCKFSFAYFLRGENRSVLTLWCRGCGTSSENVGGCFRGTGDAGVGWCDSPHQKKLSHISHEI